jgi:hypothetical protein
MFLSQQRLRQILGFAWVIVGLLQLQPQMFTMNMITNVMVPMTQGQPGIIGRNLQWITQVTTQNLTTLNIAIAVVQIGIGVLLWAGVFVRQAVIVSLIWALIVWYGGEGMSMLLTGQAGILTGAPGAVLLYPLLGFAIYPRDDASRQITTKDYAGLLSRRHLRYVFGGLWIFLALLQLQPYWWDHGQVSRAILTMVGMGGVNTGLIDPTLNVVGQHLAGSEVLINVLLTLACLTIGVGLIVATDRWLNPILTFTVVVSLLMWWFAQALGGILSGMATDFNSGLLLVILAFACWPQHAQATTPVRDPDFMRM